MVLAYWWWHGRYCHIISDLWDYSIPQVLLTLASCITLVGLDSTSTNHCSYTSGPSDLAGPEMLVNLWVVLEYVDFVGGDVMLWECCETVHVPPVWLTRAWLIMVGLNWTSTNNYSYVGDPLRRFGWSWNAGQSLSGFSTWQLHGKCCDAMRVLWDCFHASNFNMANTGMGNNG